MIYLASPYSHPSMAVREYRYRQICRVAANLLADGQMVFSPIAHCHGIAKYGDMDSDYKTWETVCLNFLELSDELCIVPMHGWEKSEGVAKERIMAEEIGIPITRYWDVEISNPPRVSTSSTDG